MPSLEVVLPAGSSPKTAPVGGTIIGTDSNGNTIGGLSVGALAAGTNNIGDVNVVTQTTGGGTPFYLTNLNATGQYIKNAPGQLYSLSIGNTQAVAIFVQVFNALTGNVTIGTTVPALEFYVAASSSKDLTYADIGVAFGTAISIYSTTTDKGATGSANGVIASGCFA